MRIDALDGSGSFDAYVAEPAGTPRAAIVVIQEIFGVNPGIRQKCDGWASKGYLALAPDLFWRLEPGIELVEARGIQRLDTRLALGARDDEARFAQDIEMLRNRRRAQVEFRHQLACRAIAAGEQLDDAAPRGIGESGETFHGVEI